MKVDVDQEAKPDFKLLDCGYCPRTPSTPSDPKLEQLVMLTNARTRKRNRHLHQADSLDSPLTSP